MTGSRFHKNWVFWLLFSLPLAIALAVWLTPLSFVPVPWPDDSAFYFVAKSLFHWPPRWVMLPQAPFEPSYRIFNFNTMPLYPILVGLGRFIGIDGSHGIKFWPLTAWALTGSLLGTRLYRAGLPAAAALLILLGFSLDPALRWASVLLRPESLIGLCGMALVLGLALGFPARFRARGLWDPASALLAVAAYSHFNAVHLVFPVIFALAWYPRRLARVGALAALYLLPWVGVVLWHWPIFVRQMATQWTRLAVRNDWLDSPAKAVASLFQNMGSPDGWPPVIHWASILLWLGIAAAIIFGVSVPVVHRARQLTQNAPKPSAASGVDLLPAAGWVIGSAWLWNSKPEVWFTYYIHAAIWSFAGLSALKAWHARAGAWGAPALAALGSSVCALVAIFGYVDVSQAASLSQSASWHWSTYHDFVDCIDRQLVKLDAELGHPASFQVWDPTFPDVTIELSRRHPDWDLTRTNDFWDRAPLAIRHGNEVDAVVVPETINFVERDVSAPMSEHPEISSAWMTWEGYFLNQLWKQPGWKPDRYLCQRGRWQAFIFMKEPVKAPTSPRS